MEKNSYVSLLGGSAVLLIGAALTKQYSLIGAVIGYWVGFVNTSWLYRDTIRSFDLDTISALRKMRKSFLSRLGLIALIVVGVARYHASWLLMLAVGITTGLLVSLIFMIRSIIMLERGDKRGA